MPVQVHMMLPGVLYCVHFVNRSEARNQAARPSEIEREIRECREHRRWLRRQVQARQRKADC